MQGQHFTYSAHLHGTLAANARGEYKLPFAASLVGVSVGGGNANDAKLDLGVTHAGNTDRDGILAQKECGDNGAPNAYSAADYNGALAVPGSPYHFQKGDVLTWDLDFDGAAGVPAQHVSIVCTFSEG